MGEQVNSELDEYMNDKIEWMRRLEVGDIVCDCRCKHLKIVEIEECWVAPRGKLYCFLTPRWLPNYFYHRLARLHAWLSRIFEWEILHDVDLKLEDGAYCSAMHCCSPPDHEQEYVSQET